ncbi:ABC transporter permease [Streptomyces albus subsp. albus]|nr:ABC transporter permease [Streptomyces albus subsp. albus]
MDLTAVLRMEWHKLRTLRALRTALAGGLLATVGITVTAIRADRPSPGPDFDAVHSSFFGLAFGQIAAICFGVLAVSADHSHQGLRIWLAAVPRRGLYYGGKLIVIGGLALAAGLLTGFGALLAGQTALGGDGVGPTAPGAARAAVGCALYLTLLTLLAAGAAAVLRSAVGTIGLLTPLLCFLSPVLGTAGPAAWLPDQAGQQVLYTHPEGPLGAWDGLALLAGQTALVVWAGWRAVRRHDA